MINYYFYETIIGYLTISADEQGITDVSFGKRNPVHAVCQETPVIKQAVSELQEYFERRWVFGFETRIWSAAKTDSKIGNDAADAAVDSNFKVRFRRSA